MSKEINLTNRGQNPYPGSGDKFMPEPGSNAEGQPIISPPRVAEGAVEGKVVDVNRFVAEMKGFPEDVLEKATRELEAKQDLPAEEARIAEAERVLNRNLTAEERNALLKAHYVGKDEAGREEGQAVIGNYTRKQLAEKARILKEEGFEKAERRTLMEEGLVGDPIDKTTFTDPALHPIIDTYMAARRGPEGKVNQVTYQILMQRLVELTAPTSGVNVVEAQALLNLINQNYEIDFAPGGDRISNSPQINDAYEVIQHLPVGSDVRRDAIMEALTDYSPHTQEFPSEFIKLALEYDETLNYLVNKIIAGPLDKETSQYQLGFYGKNNLDLLQDEMRTRASRSQDMRDKYERVVLLCEAIQLGHGLNAQIVTNNIEQFIRASGEIKTDQLQLLQKINGVPVIMRFFEEEHSRLLGRDGLIYRDNYDDVFGLKKDDEGTIIGSRDGTVVTRFKLYIERAREIGELPKELQDLQDWEIEWAFKVNKILYNMTFRASEQISTGHVPDSNDERYRSFPQESGARIMNPIGMTSNRFKVGEDRGGEVIGDMTMKNFQEQREEDGYGHTSFVKMSGGRPLDEFETSAMLGISGVFSSWRQSLVIAAEIPIAPRNADGSAKPPTFIQSKNPDGTPKFNPDGTPAMIREMTNVRQQILDLLGKEDPPSATTIRMVFLKNGELIEGFNSSLGLLLKLGVLAPDMEKDSKEIRDAKEDVRTAMWRRVARDNPLAMADFINGVEIALSKKKDDTIKIFLTDDETETGGTKTWESLVNKLTIVHEVRMGKIRNSELHGELPTFDEVLAEVESKFSNLAEGKGKEWVLTPQERALLLKIRETGKTLSGDLANVRFGYNPFMNDVLFEKMDYSNAGDEFLRRRVGGDFQSFATAAPALMKIKGNPGFIPWEKANEAMGEMVEGIAGPNGVKDARRRLRPFNRAYLSYIEKGGNVKNKALKWLAKQSIYSTIREKMRKPTSLAQEISGTGAHSLDEFGYDKVIEHQLHAGIISEEESKRLRKKHGATFGGMIAAFFRDVFIISLGAGVAEFGKQTTSSKS